MKNINWTDVSENFNVEINTNVTLADYTSYKVGGPADFLAEPETVGAIQGILQKCRAEDIPVTVIGKGSNLLISDKGIRGMVIILADNFAHYGFVHRYFGPGEYYSVLEELDSEPLAEEDGTIWFFSQSGADMREASRYASSKGASGLEFATGIPGTVGGAIYMNAGAYEGTTAEVAKCTYYLDENFTIQSVEGDAHDFSYRKSVFHGGNYIILGTLYCLKNDLQEVIDTTVNIFTAKRENSQPLEWPSCGSVFKRPEGYYAGKLIMDSGLQGVNINGAEVSTKHAGFIVNKGGAKASDIANLIKHVQAIVKANYGVELETEVRFMGEW